MPENVNLKLYSQAHMAYILIPSTDPGKSALIIVLVGALPEGTEGSVYKRAAC